MKSFLRATRVVLSFVVCLVWVTARFGASPTAQAVVADALPVSASTPLPAVSGAAVPAPAVSVEPEAADVDSVQRVELPIAWQRTKAHVVGKGTSTLTESFREVWTLERRPGGYLYLESPRARVAVFPAGGGEQRQGLPRAVVLAEGDFAKLVGVLGAHAGEADESPEALGIAGRPLTLNLAKTGRGGADITLAWSEDEHYAIHLDISSTALF